MNDLTRRASSLPERFKNTRSMSACVAPDPCARLAPPDPIAIADVIEELLASPAKLHAMSASAPRFASRYSWERSARVIEQALQQRMQTSAG